MEQRRRAPAVPPSAYIIGGNQTTLAFTSDLRAERNLVPAVLLSLAWTPVGAVVGTDKQRVSLAADNLAAWTDQTFAPDDEHAFVGSLRDLDMLMRVGWYGPEPEVLRDEALVNPEDVPEDVLDALAGPPRPLVLCAVCRRSCVRDDFLWNDRQLCAWDYHATVFGKRGPWRGVPYEERLFATLPHVAYVTPQILDELDVEPIVVVRGLEESAQRELVNRAIEAGGEASYLAVRVADGYTILRERATPRPDGD